MNILSRRSLIAGAAFATLALSACDNGLGGSGAQVIDARADTSMNFLFNTFPDTQDLADTAAGMLIMPLVTEASFGLGGSFGRGVLRVGDVSVDYYSTTQASFGFQIGAQQSAHVLFFMTEDALADFRNSPGWAAGAELKYAINERGETISADTTTVLSPVIAVVFGQAGLIAGASIEGTKYTRIIP